MQNHDHRRPLAVRSSTLMQKWAKALSQRAFPSPNQISVLSMVFALIGAIFYASLVSGQAIEIKLLMAALCVQLRLLCNLLDGMVAVEGGKSSPVGGLYNEVPDRVADTLFFMGLAYGLGELSLGLGVAVFAMGTAYIRALGVSLGTPSFFTGPMAKQHRMALLTIASLFGALEWFFWKTHWVLYLSLWGLLIGSAITCLVRLSQIAAVLKGEK